MIQPVRPTEDGYLEQLENDGLNVNIYLTNGIKLQGKVVGHDDHAVFINSKATVPGAANGSPKPQMVYKHAISTFQLQ